MVIKINISGNMDGAMEIQCIVCGAMAPQWDNERLHNFKFEFMKMKFILLVRMEMSVKNSER